MPSKQRNIAYDALTVFGAIMLLCYITRLWPLLLLALVGAIIATLVLLFRLPNAAEPGLVQPDQPPVQVDTERELIRMAFGIIQRRITNEILNDYPNARWVWESPNAMKSIANGEHVYVLLNKAGGYKRVCVEICDLQFVGLHYNAPTPVPDIPKADGSEDNEDPPVDEASIDEAPAGEANYGLLAFSWVDEQMLTLTALCSEAIARKETSFIISSSVLPDKESWDAICRELMRHDFPNAQIVEDGIRINTPQ